MAAHLQNTGIVVMFSEFINRVFIGLIITSVNWSNPVIPSVNSVRNDGRKLWLLCDVRTSRDLPNADLKWNLLHPVRMRTSVVPFVTAFLFSLTKWYSTLPCGVADGNNDKLTQSESTVTTQIRYYIIVNNQFNIIFAVCTYSLFCYH